MLVRRRLDATTQVHAVAEPGTRAAAAHRFSRRGRNAAYQPTTGDYFLFARGEGGNEVFRIYRQDVATKAVTPLTPEGVRVGGDRLESRGRPHRLFDAADRSQQSRPHGAHDDSRHGSARSPEPTARSPTWKAEAGTNFAFSEDGEQDRVHRVHLREREPHLGDGSRDGAAAARHTRAQGRARRLPTRRASRGTASRSSPSATAEASTGGW